MRLHVDDSLYEFDATDLDGERERVPSAQDVLLDGCHVFPRRRISGVIDTARPSVSQCDTQGGALRIPIAAPCDHLRELSRGGKQKRASVTYICLNTSGYKLAAFCTICFNTTGSPSGNSNISRNVCSTFGANCSF